MNNFQLETTASIVLVELRAEGGCVAPLFLPWLITLRLRSEVTTDLRLRTNAILLYRSTLEVDPRVIHEVYGAGLVLRSACWQAPLATVAIIVVVVFKWRVMGRPLPIDRSGFIARILFLVQEANAWVKKLDFLKTINAIRLIDLGWVMQFASAEIARVFELDPE